MIPSSEQADGRAATAAEMIAGHDLTGKEAIVTGGYGGVGYETVKALASAGARVVIAGRDPGRGANAVSRLQAETGNQSILFAQLDLGSLAPVHTWARKYAASGQPLHILVNNAAVMWPPQQRTGDGFESHLAINHLAHFALTLGLLPCLEAAGDARIVCLSSSAHRRSDIHYEDPNYERRPYDPAEAYGQSKTANALFVVGFSTRFAGPHLTANAVMPGAIRTGLTRHLSQDEFRARGWIDAEGNDLREGWKTPEQGAATTIWAVVAPELEGVTGKYLEDCAIATPLERADRPLGGHYDPQGRLRDHYQPYALDPGNAERLWTLSERLIAATANPGSPAPPLPARHPHRSRLASPTASGMPRAARLLLASWVITRNSGCRWWRVPGDDPYVSLKRNSPRVGGRVTGYDSWR